ncbi:MAG: excinuclease ABC subunit C [Gammaproteobacteria bacterium RIFCSPHIGHO2_12_FULL_38_14]|nr:MAG: excinuclease ABC subunit C [Gammaproteobacteria bacterium RIFCSPHIGHO2_12_FULL_38_14]
MSHLKSCITRLSHHPGVYQFLDDQNRVLYVGKAKDLKKRVSSYFSGRVKDPKTRSLIKQVKDIDVTITHSENEAVLLECNLIKQHQPRYNILLRDDKSYPYIVITSEHAYPRIDLYRGTRKKKGLYFGPYASSFAVRETISLLQKLFRIRTCQNSFFEARTRPCLLYQINRCTGPCVKLITKEEYDKNVQLAVLFLEGKNHEVIHELQNRMELASQELNFEEAALLRDQIARLRQIQERQYVNVREGDVDIVGFAMQSGIVCIQLLSVRKGQLLGSRSYFPLVPPFSKKDEILYSFLSQHYFGVPSHLGDLPRHILLEVKLKDQDLLENALSKEAHHKVSVISPTKGEKRKWLNMAVDNAKQSLALHLFNKINIHERAIALQQALNLKTVPKRIECVDVSHLSGESTVASCVVFDQQGPVKSDYRRFNISNITPGDDIAGIRQVIFRRFKQGRQEGVILPDMMLIDGGKTQLIAAHQVMQELGLGEVVLVGVAKGKTRKPGLEILHRIHSPPLHLSGDSLALHFIQQIRDEAHRFAVTAHRARRDRERRRSPLEIIPGIGAKRRRELLRYFGGIQGLAHASLEELTKVPGISHSLARRIFAAFHDTSL